MQVSRKISKKKVRHNAEDPEVAPLAETQVDEESCVLPVVEVSKRKRAQRRREQEMEQTVDTQDGLDAAAAEDVAPVKKKMKRQIVLNSKDETCIGTPENPAERVEEVPNAEMEQTVDTQDGLDAAAVEDVAPVKKKMKKKKVMVSADETRIGTPENPTERVEELPKAEMEHTVDTQDVLDAAVIDDALRLKKKHKKNKTMRGEDETRIETTEETLELVDELPTACVQSRKLKRLRRDQHRDIGDCDDCVDDVNDGAQHEAVPTVTQITEGMSSEAFAPREPKLRGKLKGKRKFDNEAISETNVTNEQHANLLADVKVWDGSDDASCLQKNKHDWDDTHVHNANDLNTGTERKKSKNNKIVHTEGETPLPDANVSNGNGANTVSDCKKSKKRKKVVEDHMQEDAPAFEPARTSDSIREGTEDITNRCNKNVSSCNGADVPERTQGKKRKHRASDEAAIEIHPRNQDPSHNDTTAAVLRFAMQASARIRIQSDPGVNSTLKQMSGTENQQSDLNKRASKQNNETGNGKEFSKCSRNGNEQNKAWPESVDGHVTATGASKTPQSSETVETSAHTAKAEQQNGELSMQCRKVCAANLPKNLEVTSLWIHFEKCGTVEDVHLLRDWYTNASRGICFVTYKRPEAAQEALKLNDQVLEGEKIRVNLALDKHAGDKGKGRGKGHDAVSSKGYGKSNGKAKSQQALTNEACSRGGKYTSKGKSKSGNMDGPSLGDMPERCPGVVVKQLSYAASDDDLREVFAGCGDGPTRIRILTDKDGNSKGKAFVDFADRSSVELAGKLNGVKIKGRFITLEYALPRNDT